MGVVSMYLFVALIATSLLRRHITQPAWRAVHWASYLMWPLALAHGITAGSDASAPWMLLIDAACIAIAAGALAWRWLDRATITPAARAPRAAAR